MKALFICMAIVTSVISAKVEAGLVRCEEVEVRWETLSKVGSYFELLEIYDQAYNESDCGSDVYARIGLAIIESQLVSISTAYLSATDQDALHELQARLDELQLYGSHWQLSFLRGEIARKLRAPTQALLEYREALALVEQKELTPVPPDYEQVALLRDRLDETSVIVAQLAPAKIKLPLNRSGELIGQYSFTTRGFARKKALVPIQFVFGKDEMTKPGLASFQDALVTLERQSSPNITVVGHTDPVGPTAYNKALSEKRAIAVKRKLEDRQYRGKVATMGMGEEEPFKFDDPQLYSEELRHQAHRRVELILMEK